MDNEVGAMRGVQQVQIRQLKTVAEHSRTFSVAYIVNGLVSQKTACASRAKTSVKVKKTNNI